MTAHSTLDGLANALPRRPIVVRPPPTIGPLAAIGLFALLFGMLGGVLWWLGPDLARDWRMRNDAVAAGDARIEEARCRAWLVVLKFCDVTVLDERDTAGGKRTLWYAFIDVAGEQRVVLQRSRSDPSLITTEFGLEKLFSRLVTLLLLCAIFMFCIGVAVVVLLKAMRARRAFAGLSGQRLVPVVVEIERNNLVPPRRRMWVYLYDDGGKQERTFVEWASQERPMFATADERWALALRGEQGGTPLLLDAGLMCLDLTEAEKAAFYDACRAAFAGGPTQQASA